MPRLLTRAAPPLDQPFSLNRDSMQAAGLVGWWPFAASGGAAVVRDLATRNDGTLTNAPTWRVHPEFGPGLAFNGTNQYLNCGSAAQIDDLPNSTNGISVAVLCQIDVVDGADRTLLAKSNDSGQGWILRVAGSNRFLFTTVRATTSASVASASLATTGSYLVVATYAGIAAGAAPKIYVNGAEVSSSAVAGSGAYASDASVNLAIARLGSGNFWYLNGSVYDARVYNRVLSPAEVWQLWAPQTRWELYRPAKWRTIVAAPAGGGDATVTPSLLSLAFSLSAPTVSATQTATATPAQLTAALSLSAPTVSTAGAATVTPAMLSMAVSLPAATASATQSASVTPSMASAALSLMAPAVSVGGSVAVSPAQITATLSLLAPTVTTAAGVTVAPSMLTLAVTRMASVTAIGPTPAMRTLALSVLAPAVTTSTTATVAPAMLALAAGVLAPAVVTAGSATVTPSMVSLTATRLASVTAIGPAPTMRTLALSVMAPTVTTRRQATVTPLMVALALSVLAPVVVVAAPPGHATATVVIYQAGGATVAAYQPARGEVVLA